MWRAHSAEGLSRISIWTETAGASELDETVGFFSEVFNQNDAYSALRSAWEYSLHTMWCDVHLGQLLLKSHLGCDSAPMGTGGSLLKVWVVSCRFSCAEKPTVYGHNHPSSSSS